MRDYPTERSVIPLVGVNTFLTRHFTKTSDGEIGTRGE